MARPQDVRHRRCAQRRAFGAPLDVFLVRKLGVPGYEELAMGAVATGGVRVLNDEIVRGLGISEHEIDAVVARELRELSRRDRLYRGDRPPSDVAGRTVILVDDGLATGATMRAAVQALRQQQPGRIVAAVPTASPDTCQVLRPRPTTSFAPLPPSRFSPSVTGMTISRRRLTMRYENCWRAKGDLSTNYN
jgi:predicted phosphoribosyltransferase